MCGPYATEKTVPAGGIPPPRPKEVDMSRDRDGPGWLRALERVVRVLAPAVTAVAALIEAVGRL